MRRIGIRLWVEVQPGLYPWSGWSCLLTLSALQVPVDTEVQAPELLASLFLRGARLLLRHLPSVWAGTARPSPQDDSLATLAPKVSNQG